MNVYKAEIHYVTEVHEEAYLMGLAAYGITREARAGQFYMIRASHGLDPFLSRPFSMHRRQLRRPEVGPEGDGLEILFQVVGKGTRFLSQRAPGERVDVFGPLGRGWSLTPQGRCVLVAGGVGVASFVALGEEMTQAQRRRARIFLGAQKAEKLWAVEDLKSLGLTVHTAVERGEHPFNGTVMDLLRAHWDDIMGISPSLFVCGPPLMLKKIATWAMEERVPCQVSLEAPMACGTGVCLGCAVKRANSESYLRACMDGPVLWARDVDWVAWDAGKGHR